MSGGGDSTLTALLLKEHGCRVVGATMSSWNNDLPLDRAASGIRNSCYGPDEEVDIEECRRFCAENGIEYHVIDVKEAYRREVLDYFRDEYRAGRTPNPCIRCNPQIKFGALLEQSRESGIGFDYFCTGHYARLVRPSVLPAGKPDDYAGGTYPLCIAQAADRTKDQSYFLYRIPSAVLERVRFPLGNMSKKDVFSLARERGLAAAGREESQDFIPDEYLGAVFADRPALTGDIVDTDGNVLGRHRGIEYYTIGQRRGLGVSSPRPLYVQAINAEKRQVVLAADKDLFAGGLVARDWVWPGNVPPREPFDAFVKIRLASPAVPARIEPAAGETEKDGAYRILFREPQRAIAPGQSAVVYRNDTVIGGGIISRKIDHE